MTLLSGVAKAEAPIRRELISGWKDLRLCMTTDEFRADPLLFREFSVIKIHGNPIMPGADLLARSERGPMNVHLQVSIDFIEGKLAEIHIRIPPYLARPQQLSRAERIYEDLRDEVLARYALGPDAQGLLIENWLSLHRLMLLVDKRGNLAALELSRGDDEFVRLSYYARGNPRSPYKNIVANLLGRFPSLCQESN